MNPSLFLLSIHSFADEFVEGDAGAEDFYHFVEEVVGKGILHLVVDGVVFVFQQVGMRPVGGIAFGHAAEFFCGPEFVAEKSFEFRSLHYGEKFVGRVVDLLTYGFEDFGFGHKYAAPKRAIARQAVVFLSHLKVVAGYAAVLPAAGGKKTGNMGLVGPFVGGESQVAIDAIDTFRGIEVAESGVYLCHRLNQCLGEDEEVAAYGVPACFVGKEPVSVVVLVEFFKEGQGVRMDSHSFFMLFPRPGADVAF